MKVKVKKLVENAKLPTKAHDKDFCYDVYATSCEEIEPGIWRYGLGFAFEIVRGPMQLGYWKQRCGCVQYTGLDENGCMQFEDVIDEHEFNIPPTHYNKVNLSLDFRPRSSIWKTGLVLSNCEGTLDELYRGEVMAYFYEVVPGKEKYKVGDRIGQIKLGFTLPIEFVEEEINTNTERGTGGFGSTGRS